jgi:hypothetical protein
MKKQGQQGFGHILIHNAASLRRVSDSPLAAVDISCQRGYGLLLNFQNLLEICRNSV